MLRSVLERFGPAPYETISPCEAHEGRSAGEVVIVDVRTAREWEKTGTPQGSKRISMNSGEFTSAIKVLFDAYPNASLAIGCATGRRSKAAIKTLRKSGVSNLKILSGGMDRWVAEDLPIDL